MGPVLEITTSNLQGKFGVEIRMVLVYRFNSHSWVTIFHCLNKLVTDFSNNKENDNNYHETIEMQFEDVALEANVLAFVSRIKAKSKPQRRNHASSSTGIFTRR